MNVSVVIATYNRSELLVRSIPALRMQVTDGLEYEVIFVDDGSTDETPDIIRRAVAESPEIFRYLRGGHSGSPAAPRNLGIRSAQGEVILLLDDDVIPDPCLLLEHFKFHCRNRDWKAAAEGSLYLPPGVEQDPMSLFHTFPYHQMKPGVALQFYFFWTCNVSLKREFMLRHGMFDEDAALYPLEDMECGYRLAQAGMRLQFLPEATGQHVHKMRPEWVAAKGQRLGRAQYAITRKVSDVRLLDWLALLSTDLPWPKLLLRVIKRALLRIVDNPLTLFVLRRAGAESLIRSKVTDFYHYLKFRRGVLNGYRAARTSHRAGNARLASRESELLPTK